MSPVAVLYIAGCGRSGSTLVDRLLGTLEGVASFNEVNMLEGDVFVRNPLCSCGERFRDCLFWKEVIAEALPHETDISRYLYLHQKLDHNWWFPSIYSGCYSTGFELMLAEYKEYLRRIYSALARVSGRQVLIDSSKSPARALLLHGIEGIQVYVLHLIRDVSALVYAWQKKKFDPGLQRLLVRRKPIRVVLFWIVINVLCELLSSRFAYSRLRYEDIAMNPREVLQKFVDSCKVLEGKQLPFSNDGLVHLESFHSIKGNPQRFVSGITKIEKDDDYKHKLNSHQQLLYRMLAYPLLKRYGYTLRLE